MSEKCPWCHRKMSALQGKFAIQRVFSLLFAFSLALPAIVLFSVALSRVSMFYAFFSASSASTRRSEETERYFLCSGTSSLESESKVRPRVRILRRIP